MSKFDSYDEREQELSNAGYSSKGAVEGKYDRIQLPIVTRDSDEWGYYRVIAETGYPHVSYPKPGKQRVRKFMFHEFRRHWIPPRGNKSGMYAICHRGLNDFADPRECPVCNSMPDNNPQPAFAFTMLDLWYQHTITEVSRKNTTYNKTVRCLAKPHNKFCTYCDKGAPRILGFRGHLVLGKNNTEILVALDARVGTHCACGGRIRVTDAACPRCHQILANVETSGMSDSEFRNYLANKQPCPNCQVLVQPTKVRKCNKCATPTPLDLTDATIKLRMVQVPGKNYTNLEGDIHKIGPLAPQYGDVKQLDLPVIYAPEPLSRLRLNVSLPRVPYEDSDPDDNAVPRTGLSTAAERGALPPDVPSRVPARPVVTAPPGFEGEFGPDPALPAAKEALRSPAPDMGGFEGDGEHVELEDIDLPELE